MFSLKTIELTPAKIVKVNAGDVIIVPAGVAHKNINQSANFKVVSAYPLGLGRTQYMAKKAL